MTHRPALPRWRRSLAAVLLLSAAAWAMLPSTPARAFRESPDLLRDPSTLRLQARAVIEGSSLSLLPSTAASRTESRVWESPSHRRTSIPLDAQIRGREVKDGLLRERVTFSSERGLPSRLEDPPASRVPGGAGPSGGAGQRVPALVIRPAGAAGPLPAVVVLHGLGGNKEGMAGLMEELARRGYLALAIDARWHGERGPGLQAAMIRAYRAGRGHPYVFDTVLDLFRTLDYLQTRPDVDPQRIGMIGVSMGGQETWITAALDPRVKVAVPVIGVNSFRWTVEHDRWHARANLLPQVYEAVRADLSEPAVNTQVYRAVWDRLTPGLLDRFDGPQLLPLIAPRPLLVLNGETDPLVPVEGARLAAGSARGAYEAAGVPERFRFEVAPGVGHAFTDPERRMALDWFDRWLKKSE